MYPNSGRQGKNLQSCLTDYTLIHPLIKPMIKNLTETSSVRNEQFSFVMAQ